MKPACKHSVLFIWRDASLGDPVWVVIMEPTKVIGLEGNKAKGKVGEKVMDPTERKCVGDIEIT